MLSVRLSREAALLLRQVLSVPFGKAIEITKRLSADNRIPEPTLVPSTRTALPFSYFEADNKIHVGLCCLQEELLKLWLEYLAYHHRVSFCIDVGEKLTHFVRNYDLTQTIVEYPFKVTPGYAPVLIPAPTLHDRYKQAFDHWFVQQPSLESFVRLRLEDIAPQRFDPMTRTTEPVAEPVKLIKSVPILKPVAEKRVTFETPLITEKLADETPKRKLIAKPSQPKRRRTEFELLEEARKLKPSRQTTTPAEQSKPKRSAPEPEQSAPEPRRSKRSAPQPKRLVTEPTRSAESKPKRSKVERSVESKPKRSKLEQSAESKPKRSAEPKPKRSKVERSVESKPKRSKLERSAESKPKRSAEPKPKRSKLEPRRSAVESEPKQPEPRRSARGTNQSAPQSKPKRSVTKLKRKPEPRSSKPKSLEIYRSSSAFATHAVGQDSDRRYYRIPEEDLVVCKDMYEKRNREFRLYFDLEKPLSKRAIGLLSGKLRQAYSAVGKEYLGCFQVDQRVYTDSEPISTSLAAMIAAQVNMPNSFATWNLILSQDGRPLSVN